MTTQSDGGFTLVETLVALVMLTMSVVAVVQIFGIGFLGIRSSELDTVALQLARSQLARAGVEAPPAAGRRDGVAGNGMAWTLIVEPYAAPAGEGRTAASNAYWITSEVRWRPSAFAATQAVQLRTLKVAPP
jgi:general secretion pathway protein I